ncbi:MAG: AAA family ATPase [Bacillota bacterium]|nr:AAA family ATPase [Bacillota bacterium]
MTGEYIQKIFLSGSFDENSSYVYSLPVIKNLIRMRGITLNRDVTFFAGENGTGKSTLLEAIAAAYGFNPEGGGWNFNFSTYRSHSPLCDSLRLWKGARSPSDGFFLRAESFYNAASYIEELDGIPAFSPPIKYSYGGKSLHEQSHGESFLALILNRFGGNGLYILDEPEAALSPSGQFTLLSQIGNLVKKRSQFIIATHSPILLAYPDADIFVLSEDDIRLTPYEETEHYVLTREFLNNPRKILKHLLQDQD